MRKGGTDIALQDAKRRWPLCDAAERSKSRLDRDANRPNGRNGATIVTLIPGDGVGPEVIGAAVTALEATGLHIQWDRQEAGAASLKKVGTPVPDSLIRSLKRTHIAFKGPLETRVGEGYRSINVYLRKTFNLYANLRPTLSFEGVHTPFRNVDLVVVRENTEDLYAGIEHQVAPGIVESRNSPSSMRAAMAGSWSRRSIKPTS